LKVRGESKQMCAERALHWINTVGLKGYETNTRISCLAVCASVWAWRAPWRRTPTSS